MVRLSELQSWWTEMRSWTKLFIWRRTHSESKPTQLLNNVLLLVRWLFIYCAKFNLSAILWQYNAYFYMNVCKFKCTGADCRQKTPSFVAKSSYIIKKVLKTRLYQFNHIFISTITKSQNYKIETFIFVDNCKKLLKSDRWHKSYLKNQLFICRI